MLYVTPDRPVDPITVSIMRQVDAAAQEMRLPYFLVGAVARDVILGHVFGFHTGRATRDVDFASSLAGGYACGQMFQTRRRTNQENAHFFLPQED